jgi:hypothetical protein
MALTNASILTSMTNPLIDTYREGKRGEENMTVKIQRHCPPLPSLFSYHGGAGKWNVLGLTINRRRRHS